MAVLQQFQASPGRKISARIEGPAPAGRPRQFWDGAARKWSADPAARVPAVEDATLPGIYRVEVAEEDARTWPDVACWLALIETIDAAPGGPMDVVLSFGAFGMCGGSDGSRPAPSVDLTLPDGRRLHMLYAYAE